VADGSALRLAYIGAGGFTNLYMYPQLKFHDLDLVAVCDLQSDRADLAARQYGFAAVYTDFTRMLDEQQPDAVICVGGPRVHYEVGAEVLRRGFPLYVQKSPAPSAAATAEMAALAHQAGVVCHVGFNIRSSLAGLNATRLIASPEFGAPALIMVRYGLVFGQTLRDAVMDQHCHAWDTLRYLGGGVSEMVVRRSRVPGDRGYVAALQMTNGAVGAIAFTSAQVPGKEFFYFEVSGTGSHFLTCHDFDLVHRTPAGPDETFVTGNFGGGSAEHHWLGYVGDVANFLAAVRGDEPDRAPIADAIPTMELCEEAYRQLREQGADE
jgi:predicted dehydrogenase